MKRIAIVATLLLLGLAIYANLPTCYHTYDQIIDLLQGYETQYPGQAKVHLLGYSQEDHVPIYGIKISNNVLQDEDQPAVLFVGQVHAEEVLGVEITLSNIKEILENRNISPYNIWLSQLEMWFVPTLNPEGHNVVTSNIDTSYRKNKRDMNGNGIFDYSPLVGYDVDGVDLNRNFWWNWVHGDTLLHPGGLEKYDYYRGPAPMSESELTAIKALCDAKKFTYSICWHSSRTGNLSEKIYYSFNWKEVRPSPDVALASAVALGVANQIPKEGGTGVYEALPNLGRKGNFHDWMYQHYGSIQLLIEVGTANLQPDSLLMVNTIQRATNGVKWLLNRALPFSTSVNSSSMLTGLVKDAVTNQALEAQIIIPERHARWMHPRTSKASTGRYYRPIAPGTYSLIARKKGYNDYIVPSLTVNNGSMTTHNIMMMPKATATLSGRVHSGAQDVSALIVLGAVEPDTLAVNGEFIIHSYVAQQIPISITAEGYYPYIANINLQAGNNSLFVDLSPITTIFSETWENGTQNWVLDGPWVLQNEESASGNAITDSWGGYGFYAINCDVNIRTASPISLPNTEHLFLAWDQHLYTEWDYDFVSVAVSSDLQEWQEIYVQSGQFDWWHTIHVPLGAFAGQQLYFRFRLTDNSTHEELTDPGWTIDNIRIFSGMATPNLDHLGSTMPGISALYPNFPNPFNPSTTIRYSLSEADHVSLDIYNMKGQKVKSLVNSSQAPGNHSVVWDGTDANSNPVSGGIYFYRLNTGKYSKTMKMVMIK